MVCDIVGELYVGFVGDCDGDVFGICSGWCVVGKGYGVV